MGPASGGPVSTRGRAVAVLPAELEWCDRCTGYLRVVAGPSLRVKAITIAAGDRGGQVADREDAVVCAGCGEVELVQAERVEAAIDAWLPFTGWNASRAEAVTHDVFDRAPQA